MRFFLSFCIGMAILVSSSSYAEIFYRHIPFEIELKKGDALVIDYDFSNKLGIQCTSNNPLTTITFTYKGHEKTSYLPVILESSHVPFKPNEELTDVTGQLILQNPQAEIKTYQVKCQYME